MTFIPGILKAAWKFLRGDAGRLIEEIMGRLKILEEEHRECEERCEKLTSEVQGLRETVSRLDYQTLNAVVIADADGIIRSWSPAATTLFYWQQEEILNKHISVLIPPRLRAKALTAFREKKATEIVLDTFGLTRNQTEFPITVAITSWEEEAGKPVYGANIKRRAIE